MKTKILLSMLALGLVITVFGQKATLELTFTAENNGQHVPLDSIFIENLTKGGDTTLYAPDTVLKLNYLTGIGDNKAIGGNSFSVSQNYPNPFNGKTEIDLYLPEDEYIRISVRDILGRELSYDEKNLIPGRHSFTFYPGNLKFYFLTVTGKQTSRTIKMLNTGSPATADGNCKIVYTGIRVSTDGLKSQQSVNAFTFNPGDELKYTAYSDIGSETITDAPEGNQTYTFQFAGGGPCPGMPTITDIDGNIYNTVQIGNQCWMKENLKTTTYNNGTQIPNITNGTNWGNLITGAYAWYNNESTWKDLYGAMYNWYAIVDTNGLCPAGWHVPTNDEWIALTDFIGGIDTPNGNKLKSCRQVNSPQGGDCNTTEHPRWNESNQHGTDDYGFSGLPGGGRSYDEGEFLFIGKYVFWWSSTSYTPDFSWIRTLSSEEGNMNESFSRLQAGLSVRCIKD